MEHQLSSALYARVESPSPMARSSRSTAPARSRDSALCASTSLNQLHCYGLPEAADNAHSLCDARLKHAHEHIHEL
jgi:hypothetical protein